ALIAHAPLMGGRNLHILPVLGYGSARNVDALVLEHSGDLLVGEGLGAILLFDHFLHFAFQQEERCTPAQRPLNRFREEIAEFEDALRRVHIFAGHGAANRGRMHAHLLGYFLDHHGLQIIQPVAEEFGLPPHDGLANLEDGLLALLDILHQLDSRRVPLAHVIPDFLGGAVLAIQHLTVLRVQAKLRDVLIVHLNDVIFAVLGKEDVRLHHPCALAISLYWRGSIRRRQLETICQATPPRPLTPSICSSRHSRRLRAPTPAGLSDCTARNPRSTCSAVCSPMDAISSRDAERYPSSSRLPMIDSAASRVSSLMTLTLNCERK